MDSISFLSIYDTLRHQFIYGNSMTARLLLLAMVSLIAAGAVGTTTAVLIVTLPTIVAQNHAGLAPGSVWLMGAALALVYALMRPRKQQASKAH
jgi:hypothetical protein